MFTGLIVCILTLFRNAHYKKQKILHENYFKESLICSSNLIKFKQLFPRLLDNIIWEKSAYEYSFCKINNEKVMSLEVERIIEKKLIEKNYERK